MRIDKTFLGCSLDGDGSNFDIWGLSELAKPRAGRVIPVASSVSMGLVGLAAVGILGLALLKKKRML